MSLPSVFRETPGPERLGRIWLQCFTCKTYFERKRSEHARGIARGKKHPYCSTTCSKANSLRSAPANTIGRDLDDAEVRRALATTFKHARKNAKADAIAFELTEADVDEIYKRAGGRCEISKLPFRDTEIAKAHERRPFMPSLDRIDSTLGYTKANCRLVLSSVNLMMNGWGECVTKDVIIAVVEQMLKESDPRALALIEKFSTPKSAAA